MKKILFSLFLLSMVTIISCKKSITDYNTNSSRPAVVPSGALFSNASVNLSDVMASTNVNTNNFRLFVQYWTEATYVDESRYNLNQRSIPDLWFAALYRDVIKDLTEASRVAETETLSLSAAEIKNRKAINEILIVYSYYTLITSFGNVPYTDALDINNLQPKYDDAAQIFAKISQRLNAALSNLDASAGSYGSADLILSGSVSGWKKFGNSLKMRMGMLVADSDANTAKTMVTEAAPNVIASNGENIKMNYLSSPPNTNPVWEDLVQSGRHDFIAASTIIDTLKKLSDPRLPLYFNQAVTAGRGFVGQTPGVKAPYNNYASPSDEVASPTHPFTFFSYAEMEFLKAEAVERGFGISGSAESHYNNGIDASIQQWGGTAAQALTYRSQPSVAYTTAAGTYKQKIGLQSWLALYDRGYDAWTQWRRLDFPKLPVPTNAIFADNETAAVIRRLTYPVVEQNLNKANYQAASSAIGKDEITQRLWFDKF